MGLFDRVKDFINSSDADYMDEAELREESAYDPGDVEYEEEAPAFSAAKPPRPEYAAREPVMREPAAREPAAKVVDFGHSSASARPHVVFKKLDRFEDVAEVADVLNERRIVILNLETCPNDVSRRIIDFLYGVAYANNGEIKSVASRAYIITPYNVPISGEMLDGMNSAGGFSKHFFD